MSKDTGHESRTPISRIILDVLVLAVGIGLAAVAIYAGLN